MEEPTSPEEIASTIEAKSSDVSVEKVGENGRITFTLDGVAHAMDIPDEYEVVGIGTGWFAIQ